MMAAGNRECFCPRCDKAMGSPGKMKNVLKHPDKSKGKKSSGPNTGKYFG